MRHRLNLSPLAEVADDGSDTGVLYMKIERRDSGVLYMKMEGRSPNVKS